MSQENLFDNNYQVLLADTQESKRIHYQLRYQVYCDEMRFEDKNKFPNQLETDQWDKEAIHFIVRHKSTGHYLGALRLAQGNKMGLPLEKHSILFNELKQDQYSLSLEISRLCVIKEARRFIKKPIQTHNNSISTNIKEYRPSNRELMWGMIRAAALYSHSIGIQKWYILVAPALAVTIQKAGFNMVQVGHPCQLKGARTPYLLDVDQVLSNPLWQQDYQNKFIAHSELEQSRDKMRLIA